MTSQCQINITNSLKSGHRNNRSTEINPQSKWSKLTTSPIDPTASCRKSTRANYLRTTTRTASKLWLIRATNSTQICLKTSKIRAMRHSHPTDLKKSRHWRTILNLKCQRVHCAIPNEPTKVRFKRSTRSASRT